MTSNQVGIDLSPNVSKARRVKRANKDLIASRNTTIALDQEDRALGGGEHLNIPDPHNSMTIDPTREDLASLEQRSDFSTGNSKRRGSLEMIPR